MTSWPPVDYPRWAATCDTLHAHTQLLGKLAAALAPREPRFQHLALRLSARGWETAPLPALDRSGAFVAGLDLHQHEAFVEHSAGDRGRVALAPDRAVADVAAELLEVVREVAGPVSIDPAPQEVHWSVPLDQDREHAAYDPVAVGDYFTAATRAALVLGAARAAHAGPASPLSAWWGSFDVAVSLFGGGEDTREVAIGWWPGDPRYPRAAFYAYATPAPADLAGVEFPPPARFDRELGEFVLDWEELRTLPDPHTAAVEFARSALAGLLG